MQLEQQACCQSHRIKHYVSIYAQDIFCVGGQHAVLFAMCLCILPVGGLLLKLTDLCPKQINTIHFLNYIKNPWPTIQVYMNTVP